ncbi:hypothetical protein M0R45_006291 [Rubus argutus]|uniref:TMV resistance protein N n=1 Tax=Rubus argutus TaxID=59490 RepID=A0AAW1YQM3_RUBAR
MDARIGKMESYLDLRSDDVLTIGIWGMGGIGKTTLAKEVFKKIRSQFDTSGFVSNVRLHSEEKALVELQKLLCGSFFGDSNISVDTVGRGIRLLKKVLHKKKVLIVLDDVDALKQLQNLAPGKQDEENSWGPGSRLIITTRDRRTLTECGVLKEKIYEVEKLSDVEAFQLMSQKAFKENYPPDKFVELLESFVRYASCLPLAHTVLGSYLSGRNINEWSEALDRLDEDPDKDIFSVLQISFDGLKDLDKKIFLDIACFFNGEDHVHVKGILKSCGFSPEIGITDLINKSLIKIERKKLWMHDLLQQLGWHIVRRESPFPGNRSRLWLNDNANKNEGSRSWRFEDAREVLTENTGTPAIEGLFLSLPEKDGMQLDSDLFLTMRNLRLLKICNVNFLNVNFTYLSKKLRFLEWHECPLEILSSCFEPDQLVEFKMPNSRIKLLWNEKLSLKMLILMDLSDCQYLTKTLDFSKVPKLERLILKGCKELSEVHPTIGDLQHLVLLNLKGCESLESLPQSISMRSLRTCILSGCSKLKQFPEILGNMDTLSQLYLDGTAIRELPVSIQHLRGLILLNLSGCKNLLNLPSVLCSSLTSLKFLNLSLCSSVEKLPENISSLKHLEELDACDTPIRKVPESISCLKNLKLLCFHGCSKSRGLQLPNSFSGLSSLTTLNLGGCNLADGAIPDDIGYVFSLQSLDLSGNNFLSIPESISQLSELKEISLRGCGKLQLLPKNPPEFVENVDVCGCRMLTTSHGWKRLAFCKGLNIVNCRKPEEVEMFHDLHKFPLKNLKKLDLFNCKHLTKIPNLKEVPNLKELKLEGCKMLSEIHPTVWGLQHLVLFNLKGCINLESLPRSIGLRSLKVFILSGCSKLRVFPEMKEEMKNLLELHLDGTALRNLPTSIHHLEGLSLLNLSGCKNFFTVPNLLSLQSLNLSGCSLISKLPVNLASMEHLEELDASDTAIREVPQSISHLDNLKVLSFSGCKGLQLPKGFSDLRSLRSLNVRRCGVAEELVRDSICRLFSLQILDLSENNYESIPNEIGLLSSLQRLYLSENNFVSLPESISQLSKLRELELLRCNKLQSLPKVLFNLKLVDARDCPKLKKYADTFTIWGSGTGFCFIHCGQSDQDDDRTSHVPLPEDSIELLFPKYIKDRIYGQKPFEIRIPHSTRIPNLCHHWTSGPCVEIQLSDSNSAWMGFALFVVFEILQKDDFDQSWELEETICNFYTHAGHENSLVFQNFIDFRIGSSYMLCCYEPRGGQFGGLLDNASALFGASVTTKRPDLKVKGCAIHPISQQDVAKFVQKLTNQTLAQHLDSNFWRHCEEILDEITTSDHLMELGSTSTVNQDSWSKSNSNTQPRGELSKLYEGSNGREKSFYFCFPAPVISIPPWFFNHHAGDVTLCYITENLLDDQTWLGLELYVVFTRRTSVSSEGDTRFIFHVDLCSHDHESLAMHGSLKIYSCLGTSHQLVVLHVPRIHFRQQLNQCHGISALFRTINPEMEILVCGSRLVFEQDLEDLIHSLIAVVGTLDLEEHVDQRNAVEGEMPINCHSWFQRSTTAQVQGKVLYMRTAPKKEKRKKNKRKRQKVLAERAPPSSIRKLRNYRCYLQQKQGFAESDLTSLLQSVILFHSKGGRFLENRDSKQEYVAEEDATSWLACDHHVRIMAETLFYGSYTSQQWKRCLQLLLQYSKAATLSLGGHTISVLKSFNPSSTYNICFSDDTSLLGSTLRWRTSSDKHRVGMKLPPKLCDHNNWRGLVVCVVFGDSNYRRLTSSSSGVKLVCHLRSNDYCLNPMPTCSITADKFYKPTWLTYIPRSLLTEFNVISDVEARIYINRPGLKVHRCDIGLLYEQEEEEFQKFITDCWTSFFDKLPLIRPLLDADDDQRRRTTPMLEPHIKGFDRDLIYNATLPSNKIPEWFGELGEFHERSIIEFQLPSSPSLSSDQDWIGLALFSTFPLAWTRKFSFTCSLHTKKNGFYNDYHKYEATNRRLMLMKQNGLLIWLSYIPRQWFLHQLNGESVLFASFLADGRLHNMAGHRFVYEHNVEEFKQLCINYNFVRA